MLETDLSPTTKNQTVYLADYQPPLYLINQVTLEFKLADENTLVTAVLHIKRNGKHDKPLVLNGEKLTLLSVILDESVLTEQEYVVDDTTLTINQPPSQFTLTIQTQLQPQLNTELSGLYQSSGNFCTQCEAEGFRRITYFLDRPDVLAEYQVTIIANKAKYPVLLSNGNPLASGQAKDGQHWQTWHDPHPKPSYLFALVAGDLQHISDQFTTCSGQPVVLNIYTQAHNINKCEHAMQSLKQAMIWDEKVYGREYDLDIYNIVAVDDFNMGAMENKGLNIFNSKYVLANQQTATDSDYEGIESVIAHEYFHNWSGNRVTCRDWFQLSLKEGFTVFRDQEFSADMGSRGVKRIQDVQVLRTHQFKEDAGPMAHPVRPESYQEINNFYTVTIYNKGAEVIRMLHHLLSAEQFRKGTDLYFSKHDGQAVTTEHFVQALEQANDVDLTQFRFWYSQSGTPVVSVSPSYNHNVKQFSLTMTQHCPATPGQTDKKPFYIPIKLALFDDQGHKMQQHTLVLSETKQTFVFDHVKSKPVVSFLRGFSAPIKVAFAQSNQALALLMQYDDDGFARWEAGQRLSLNLILPALDSPSTALDESVYQQLLASYKTLLTTKQADNAILAEMLRLPSENYIAEQLSPINPQRIHNTRNRIMRKLAADLEPQFIANYQAHAKHIAFSLSPTDTASRALKNITLAYLVQLEKIEYYELAQQQYYNANNMTDRIAAFQALVHSQWHDKQHIIEHFYQQWQNDDLVLDKWFTIQATMPGDGILSHVKTLMADPTFSLKNPNKVRALIGAFTGNALSFHHVDGSGYEFLADIVMQLNTINPQIAARLVNVFNRWQQYSAPLSENMQQQLKRINETDNLAKDVKEIISKSLT